MSTAKNFVLNDNILSPIFCLLTVNVDQTVCSVFLDFACGVGRYT